MPKSCRSGELMSMRRCRKRADGSMRSSDSFYNRVFTQRLNLWVDHAGMRGLMLDPRLGKKDGDGFTPWHADAYYWPLATEKCCMVWIPLQKTPLKMRPLAFSEKAIHLPMVEVSRSATRARRRFKRRFQMRNFPKCRNCLIWAR